MNFPKRNCFISVATIALYIFTAVAIAQQTESASIQKTLAELEISSGGRLGISAIDTATNKRIQYHGDERFPMGCTSKVIGVAAILKKSMSDHQYLNERVTYSKEDLLSWLPNYVLRLFHIATILQ